MKCTLDWTDFQIIECDRLGITPEQHNKIVEVALKTSAAMGSSFGVEYQNIIIACQLPVRINASVASNLIVHDVDTT